VFGVGRRKNHQTLVAHDLRKIQPGEVRHVDVEKNQVDRLGFQEREGFNGVDERLPQLQKRHLAGMGLDDVERNRFIVDGDTAKLSGPSPPKIGVTNPRKFGRSHPKFGMNRTGRPTEPAPPKFLFLKK